jgi:hypothetical protein
MSKQFALKPQDVVVAAKLAVGFQHFTYAQLSSAVGLAPSQVHASVKALRQSRLLAQDERDDLAINRFRLIEFLIHGVPYMFPATVTHPTKGLATVSALDEMKELFLSQRDYVWPFPGAKDTGVGLVPLHHCVFKAVQNDLTTYRILMAVDAIRIGDARERDVGISVIRRSLA